jgi:hypothetical protein
MPNRARANPMGRVTQMKEQIELAVAIAADGNPYPLIELYQKLSAIVGHTNASTMVQRYGLEVFV